MRQGKHFLEQINQLLTEVEFALQWDSPIILLAIYRSSHVFDDAEASLSIELEEYNQELIPIRVRSNSFNIAKSIAEIKRENSIFSIADLSLGGGENDADAYRSLNLNREYFIEENIRCVLWLTEQEVQQLSLIAPDFWAFRHRVIDLVEDRATPKSSASFQGLTRIEWPWNIFENDFEAALAYREKLLIELPDQPETTLMRINLYAEIAGLYVQEEHWKNAWETLKEGITKTPSNAFPELEARLYIGLAIILIQLKDFDQAHAALKKAEDLNIDYKNLLVLFAQVNRLKGRRSKALGQIKRAISLDPELAAAWNERGNIFADLGRITQALSAYQKAFDLSPNYAHSLINKSALLVSINRLDEALNLLNNAQIDNEIDLREIMKMKGFGFLAELK